MEISEMQMYEFRNLHKASLKVKIFNKCEHLRYVSIDYWIIPYDNTYNFAILH